MTLDTPGLNGPMFIEPGLSMGLVPKYWLGHKCPSYIVLDRRHMA